MTATTKFTSSSVMSNWHTACLAWKIPNPVISLAFRAGEFQLLPVSPCSRLSAAFCLISHLLCIHNASPFCVMSWLNLSASTSYDNIIHGENKQDRSQDWFQRNSSDELCSPCYCLCSEEQLLSPTSISSTNPITFSLISNFPVTLLSTACCMCLEICLDKLRWAGWLGWMHSMACWAGFPPAI